MALSLALPTLLSSFGFTVAVFCLRYYGNLRSVEVLGERKTFILLFVPKAFKTSCTKYYQNRLSYMTFCLLFWDKMRVYNNNKALIS